MKLNYIFLSSVADLPITISSARLTGAIALPSISGDGAYLLYEGKFYELLCDETSCSWKVMPQKADENYPMAMYLPSDYFC